MREHVISIDAEGNIGALYSDTIAPLLRAAGGEVYTVRASDVEPDGQGWSAWLRPDRPTWIQRLGLACLRLGFALARHDAIKLGPYPTRDEALAAEVAYLEGDRE